MIDPTVALAGLFVGFVVGLTGMGGGALMTPILILLFKIQPLAAVSSDVVAAMVMKPIGGAVPWRRGTVNRGLVTWLMLGSIPSSFLGVLLLRRVDAAAAMQSHIKGALGVAFPAPACAHVPDRGPGRPGRGPHLRPIGVAHHRHVAAALPAPPDVGAG